MTCCFHLLTLLLHLLPSVVAVGVATGRAGHVVKFAHSFSISASSCSIASTIRLARHSPLAFIRSSTRSINTLTALTAIPCTSVSTVRVIANPHCGHSDWYSRCSGTCSSKKRRHSCLHLLR